MKLDLKLAAYCLMFAVSATSSLVLLGTRVQEPQAILVGFGIAAFSAVCALRRFRRVRNFPIYLQEKQTLENLMSNGFPLSEALGKLMLPLRVISDAKGFSFQPGKVRVIEIEGMEIQCRVEARDDAIQKIEFN